jgi:YidC/Oxa1 family membrane protein insertase
MSEKKSGIDPITILGVAGAIGLFLALQMYTNSKHEHERKAYEVELAKWQAEQDALKATQPQNVTPANTQIGPATPADSAQPAPANTAQAEPERAKDIVVSTDRFDLIFTADGGALRHAVMNDEWLNPLTKTKKGLDILAEIEAHKLTFGITRFEIRPKGAQPVVFEAAAGALRPLHLRIWKLDSDSGSFDAAGERKIVYSTTLEGGYTVTRTYTIFKASRTLRHELTLTNGSSTPVNYSYVMLGPAGVLLDGPPDNPKTGAAVFIKGEMAGRPANPPGGEPNVLQIFSDGVKGEEAARTVSYEENLWACVKNRFFTAMLISQDPAQVIRFTAEPITGDHTSLDKRFTEHNMTVVLERRVSPEIAADSTSTADSYTLYLGPSMPQLLHEVEVEVNPPKPIFLATSVQYVELFYKRWPTLNKLAMALMWLFTALHDLFGNYGIAVILLTLVIKVCLHPLQRKMMIGMHKLQKLQPELKKIQEKYKGKTSIEARQKLAMEQQDLMRKAGANPVAGCLPMFVQIPVFSALYGIFNAAYPIRGASFLWIHDLSQSDKLFVFQGFPREINLLPLIYAVTTIVQSRINAAPPSDDPQQETTRKMMMYMPVMFAFIFYYMPSGLVLYFAAQAVFGMCEYWYIKKFLIKDGPGSGTTPTVQVSSKPPAPVVN